MKKENKVGLIKVLMVWSLIIAFVFSLFIPDIPTQAASKSISISGVKVPKNLPKGYSYGIKGKVTSNYKISKVTGSIGKKNGGTVYIKTVSPNATSYNLSGSAIDTALKFNNLQPGEYIYIITATDSKGATTTAQYTFKVRSESLYLKQNTTYTCTLASAAMMLRQKAYLGGYSWWTITENSIKGNAWINNAGLKNTFSTNGVTVTKVTITGSASQKKSQITNLLNKHPEGLVLYTVNGSKAHAVWLKSISGGTFRVVDPASGYSGCVRNWNTSYSNVVAGSSNQNTMLSRNTYVWYIK